MKTYQRPFQTRFLLIYTTYRDFIPFLNFIKKEQTLKALALLRPLQQSNVSQFSRGNKSEIIKCSMDINVFYCIYVLGRIFFSFSNCNWSFYTKFIINLQNTTSNSLIGYVVHRQKIKFVLLTVDANRLIYCFLYLQMHNQTFLRIFIQLRCF